MKVRMILIICLVVVAFSCCDTSVGTSSQTGQIIVQAYIYANEPVVRKFYLSELLSLDSDSASNPINGASVTLGVNGAEYQLSDSSKSGYYSYVGSGWAVNAGDTVFLSVEYDGSVATAQTIVPEAPENLQVSDTFKVVGRSDIYSDDGSKKDSLTLNITWENSDSSYFFVVVDNLDSVQKAFPSSDGSSGSTESSFSRKVTSPKKIAHYKISLTSLGFYGRYRVKVFRVNQEYIDMLESADQDSRYITEPMTNIENGLGIFTAFNCDSVFFKVSYSSNSKVAD